MGVTYLNTGDLIQAEQTLLEALKVATDLGYQTAIANNCGPMGRTFIFIFVPSYPFWFMQFDPSIQFM